MRKKLDWFIIIMFVPKMPKQVKCFGHICLVATGTTVKRKIEIVETWFAAIKQVVKSKEN